MVLGSIGVEGGRWRGRDDDHGDHDDDGDDDSDVCVREDVKTPSSSSSPSSPSTPLRGVILDRLTTRRLLNLHDVHSELHRVLSLFHARSTGGDTENLSLLSSAAALTATASTSISPQSSNSSNRLNQPHPANTDHTDSSNDSDMTSINIVNFESLSPQQQVHTLAHTDILLAAHGAG